MEVSQEPSVCNVVVVVKNGSSDIREILEFRFPPSPLFFPVSSGPWSYWWACRGYGGLRECPPPCPCLGCTPTPSLLCALQPHSLATPFHLAIRGAEPQTRPENDWCPLSVLPDLRFGLGLGGSLEESLGDLVHSPFIYFLSPSTSSFLPQGSPSGHPPQTQSCEWSQP